MTSWTGENLARAERLWKDGKSASEIAAELGGMSRNAVIGVAHRKGWSQGGVRMAKPRAAPKPRPASPRARHSTAAQRESLRKVMGRPTHKGPYVPAPVLVEPPASGAVTLMQRTSRQCCWPVGEATGIAQLFCAAPKELEESYCPWHRRKAWARTA